MSTNEDLVRRRGLRGAQRAAVTRAIGQIRGLIAEPELDRARLNQKRLVLGEKREIIKRLDDEILQLVPDDELETEVERADEVQEQLELALIQVERALAGRTSRPPSPPTGALEPHPAGAHTPPGGTPGDSRTGGAVTGSVTVTSSPVTTTETTPPIVTPPIVTPPIVTPPSVTTTVATPLTVPSRIKLPELTIRKFNGDLTKWSTFWDTFESTIHRSPVLSDIEKFSYLQSLLESSAAEAISGLALTSANYEEAISTLKKRYGNRQLIISRHMDVLMNLESVSSQHDTRRLRRLFDTVETQVRGLRSLGVPVEAYGGLLSSVMMNKLPPEIRLIVTRGLSSDSWDLDRVLQLFEAELAARERVSVGQPRKPGPGRSPPTSSTLATNTITSCVYCGQGHASDSCSTVPTSEARRQSLRQSGRCYICLRRNHISRNCRSSIKCSRCQGKHHSSICQGQSRQGTGGGAPNGTGDSSTPTSSMYVSNKSHVMLQTATVVIHGTKRNEPTYQTKAVLDCGSQRTYVTSHIQRVLSLPTSGTERVEIKTFGSTEGSKRMCDVVHLNVIARDGFPLRLSALVVPHICDTVDSASEALMGNYPHLMDLDLADVAGSHSSNIGLLIGADYYWTLVSGRVQRGESGPIAIETRIGWVLSGPMECSETEKTVVGFVSTRALRVEASAVSEDVDEGLRRFWELESLGIRPSEESVQTRFTQTVAFKNGRYEVSLPWREGCRRLPENYDLCVKRLHGLHRRLQHDPELLQAYDGVIREQAKEGIVEEVPLETPNSLNPIHYLPHHPVVRRDKATTKVRVVFDASCSEGAGMSLNQCLHVGPNFGQSILDILLRFRLHKIALVGDVEKAFLMVSVTEKDRDVLRFLWFEDPLAPAPTPIKYRFTRVVFGVSASPFLLNATIKHHIEQYKDSDPSFVAKFLRDIYVDDLSTGATTENTCYEFYLKAKIRLAEAGFNLRKFASNSPSLLKRIVANEEQRRGSPNPPGNATDHKVLGMPWNSSSDHIIFDVRPVVSALNDLEPTKRSVVGAAARIYDPLGILSPITICFKMFFQRLCLAKLQWDDQLTGDLLQQWQILISRLSRVEPMVIPRYLPRSDDASLQLVGFCDASQCAYAAVVYLRIAMAESITTGILAAKTRVAPLKTVTIPRLELLSALLLSRLVHSVSSALKEEVQLQAPICFTDSEIALCWVRRSGKEWKQFVENRASEIRRYVPAESWQHCPGSQNPADLPSRGLNPSEHDMGLKFWLHGPDWLKEPLHPKETVDTVPIPEECLSELRNHGQEVTLFTACVPPRTDTIVRIEDFSSFKKLLRVMSYVFQFVRLTRRRRKDSVDDSIRAHEFLIRTSQAALPQNSKFKLWAQQFGLFKDEHGLWRCRGRLSNASIPPDMRFPLFLDKGDMITRLIAKDCHERMRHSGVNGTLAEVRSRYWVVRGRQLVKQVIHRCVPCRRFQGKPYQAPPPPPLPLMRVDEKPPFSYAGVDFAGPVYARETVASDSRKIWICLYTCCVTRAVHIDLVTEMKATAFLRSFKRFTARRGIPTRVLSDNGKTFKAADKLLSTILSDPRVAEYFTENKICWQFNVERAPWWGGVFERMIQSTKRLLRKIIGTAKLTFDELLTAVIEVEAILNSRPLTYMTADELIEPLTPSHLLCGRRILTFPDTQEIEDEYQPVEADKLTRRMKHLAYTLESFWTRWRKEYLLELRDSHRKSNHGNSGQPHISIGDVVTIEDEALPRAFWRLGIIIDLLVGKDGEVRAALVKTHTKGGKVTNFKRPIQKLYPLEINDPPRNLQVDDPSTVQTGPNEATPTAESRPKRAAAVQAQERIASWTSELNILVTVDQNN